MEVMAGEREVRNFRVVFQEIQKSLCFDLDDFNE